VDFGQASLHLISADLAIAATAIVVESKLLTCNAKHFPMFADLRKPY
jgi:predicted nucleic acid-binding protein